MVYFDNAATTRNKPHEVYESAYEYLLTVGVSPGRGSYQLGIEASRRLYKTRCCVGKFFGLSKTDRVIFTKNSTEAINLFLYGFLKCGDHVIISCFEHNAVLRPLETLKRSRGILDIKVAFTPPSKALGMYHEKVGILTDEFGNKIVFTGSLNETINAFHINSESIVVFKSWEESKAYVDDIQKDFDQLWNKEDSDLEILDFPKVLKEKFRIMRKPEYDSFIFCEEQIEQLEDFNSGVSKTNKGFPCVPEGFEFRPYQTEAINRWVENGYRGIFDMATGTGKTYTGLGAVSKLFENHKKLATLLF